VGDRQVRAREIDALKEALAEQALDAAFALTESDREDMTVGKRAIRVRPLTTWLCGLTE
jgi:hypothetical protein